MPNNEKMTNRKRAEMNLWRRLGRLVKDLQKMHFDHTSEKFKMFVATLLGFIDPLKAYGARLFNALTRLTWSIAMEGVTLRKRGGKIQVYLRRRADDDTNYPGEWHAPGAAFRPREMERDVADRLSKEFDCIIVQYRLIGVSWNPREDRGSFQSLVYLLDFLSVPREDDRHGWYDVDNLPPNTVDVHRDNIIPMAVAAYQQSAGDLNNLPKIPVKYFLK